MAFAPLIHDVNAFMGVDPFLTIEGSKGERKGEGEEEEGHEIFVTLDDESENEHGDDGDSCCSDVCSGERT